MSGQRASEGRTRLLDEFAGVPSVDIGKQRQIVDRIGSAAKRLRKLFLVIGQHLEEELCFANGPLAQQTRIETLCYGAVEFARTADCHERVLRLFVSSEAHENRVEEVG